MSGNPRFLIGEKDGVELEYNEEYIPESADILYEEGDTVTVKSKLDELEQLTSYPYGYGVKFIDDNELFVVPHDKCHVTEGLLINYGLIDNCNILVVL